MTLYYASRGVVSMVFGGLVFLVSKSILAGLLLAVLVFTVFLWLPRSGRYKVFPNKGVTALRRDEWSQSINQRSGRNAWVIVTLGGSGLVLYYGLVSPGDVPNGLLGGLLLLGLVTYYLSDLWMRRL